MVIARGEWTHAPLMPNLSFSSSQTRKVRQCSVDIMFDMVQAAGETCESVIRDALGDSPDVSKALRK